MKNRHILTDGQTVGWVKTKTLLDKKCENEDLIDGPITKRLRIQNSHIESLVSREEIGCIKFLVADTRLYTLPCRSVGWSVRHIFEFCSCPTIRNWISVYPALFFLPFHIILSICFHKKHVPVYSKKKK